MNRGEIFGNRSSFEARYIPDFGELAELVSHIKALGQKVVLTSGSFDMMHRDHLKYLEKAKAQGDILVVGVESDEKIRKRKNRYVAVPEMERLEMLTHSRHVDIVTLKQATDERWHLIKTVRPHALVIVAEEKPGPNGELIPESYTAEEMVALKEWCGEVVLLERQGSVSATSRIRQVMIEGASGLKERVNRSIEEAFWEYTGGQDPQKRINEDGGVQE